MPRTSDSLLPRLAALLVALMTACSGPSPSASQTNADATASATGSVGPSQPPASTGPTQPPLRSGPDRLRVELVADGLSNPIGIVGAGDGGALYVNEQGGRIRVIEADGSLRADPFVDLSGELVAGGERGLLGIAFHPDYQTNRRLFVHYSRAGDGATVVSELRARADGRTADPASERVLFTVAQPYVNHNGGQLAFGPDGYLYLGLGDGGSGGDPLGNGQNRGALLGKILRFDVDATPSSGRAYALPQDNPFGPDGISPGDGLPEIWAIGLRNPWRFSFDRAYGDIYIADVGQGSWEEIDRQPAGSRGGENYGWNVMEGSHCFRDECDPTGLVLPIAEYDHDAGCSVTGGYVYRGEAQPVLQGVYVFADYCSGTVFTLQVAGDTITPKPVLDSGLNISAFGEDDAGELYLADHANGGIYRVLVDE
jgi:glucose/arabinose dehydrogenase